MERLLRAKTGVFKARVSSDTGPDFFVLIFYSQRPPIPMTVAVTPDANSGPPSNLTIDPSSARFDIANSTVAQ